MAELGVTAPKTSDDTGRTEGTYELKKKSHLFIEFPSVRPNVLTIVERRKLFFIYNISSLAHFAAPRLCRRGGVRTTSPSPS